MNNVTKIFDRAVTALRNKLPLQEIAVRFQDDSPHLEIMGKTFLCKIESSLTIPDLVRSDKERGVERKNCNIIYVTQNANGKILELAQNLGVNVIDCAGNYAIRYIRKDGKLFFMLGNKGETPVTEVRPNTYPIFKGKGIRVIFYFLMAKNNISKPYREIQDATGVSIGTVKNIIDGMIYHQFARIESGKRFLINVDKLLMLWGANYCQTLRPKLFLAKMKFRDGSESVWKNVDLPDGMLWGGEAASALYDNYLTPGAFTIYSDVPAPTIMKTRAVEPDDDGNILIYEKFWNGDSDFGKCVPPVLTYAELMDTGNGRCVEAAQKLKENELSYLF